MKRKFHRIHFLHISIILVLILNISCKKDSDKPVLSDIVIDIDGNIYHFDTIGIQIWMRENLKVARYRNGDSIPYIANNDIWKHMRSEGYCHYRNNDSIANIYGHMYNWYAATDPRNICPEGWHIPSYSEWLILKDYLGGMNVAGGKMKEQGTIHWTINVNATNESGFTALPGGYRSQWTGGFTDIGKNGNFWTTMEQDSIWAVYCWVRNTEGYFHIDNELKNMGFSLRCIKD